MKIYNVNFYYFEKAHFSEIFLLRSFEKSFFLKALIYCFLKGIPMW